MSTLSAEDDENFIKNSIAPLFACEDNDSIGYNQQIILSQEHRYSDHSSHMRYLVDENEPHERSDYNGLCYDPCEIVAHDDLNENDCEVLHDNTCEQFVLSPEQSTGMDFQHNGNVNARTVCRSPNMSSFKITKEVTCEPVQSNGATQNCDYVAQSRISGQTGGWMWKSEEQDSGSEDAVYCDESSVDSFDGSKKAMTEEELSQALLQLDDISNSSSECAVDRAGNNGMPDQQLRSTIVFKKNNTVSASNDSVHRSATVGSETYGFNDGSLGVKSPKYGSSDSDSGDSDGTDGSGVKRCKQVDDDRTLTRNSNVDCEQSEDECRDKLEDVDKLPTVTVGNKMDPKIISALQNSSKILNGSLKSGVPVVKKIEMPNVQLLNGHNNKNPQINSTPNKMVISKLNVCELLSNNKNLTISIVRPATNSGSGQDPYKNNFSLPKAQEGKKFVKCQFCGALSSNSRSCDTCHKVNPQISITGVARKPLIQFSSLNLTKRQFYGAKLKEHSKVLPEGSKFAEKNFGENTPARRVVARRGIAKKQEPVCLTLSSDEEGEEKGISAADSLSANSNKSEAAPSDDDNTSEHSASSFPLPECSAGRTSPSPEAFTLTCRSIRIGTFRIVDKHTVSITPNFISFPFTTCKGNEIHVNIFKKDIIELRVNFGNVMPIVFLIGTTALGSSLRSLLGMTHVEGPYYDPDTEDETQKRICLIPDKNSSLFQEYLIQNYGKKIDVIDKTTANEILVRSTPSAKLLCSEPQLPGPAKTNPDETRSVAAQVEKSKQSIYHMATYPPQPSSGRISITTEDYECLNPEEFLNDAIIDFYLKYLFLEKLSEEDRNRTHIFSSFFYERLTHAQTEYVTKEDSTLKPQQRRHARVKKWTRNIDIFSKDFIIIPVNEKSHWFLAIICFPGLVEDISAKRPPEPDSFSAEHPPKQPKLDDETSVQEDSSEMIIKSQETDDNSNHSNTSTIAEGETSKLQPQRDVLSSANEASQNISPEDELKQSESTPNSDPSKNEESIGRQMCKKVPCIFIFDSLKMPRGHTTIISILREYLMEEWAAKKQQKKIFSKDNIKGMNLKVPQQNNYSDCGIYVLQYVESFFETPILNFKIPISGLEQWFSCDLIQSKRNDIQTLIRKLASDQGNKYELPEVRQPKPSTSDNNVANQVITSSSEKISILILAPVKTTTS